jgi:hypothetical protein
VQGYNAQVTVNEKQIVLTAEVTIGLISYSSARDISSITSDDIVGYMGAKRALAQTTVSHHQNVIGSRLRVRRRGW